MMIVWIWRLKYIIKLISFVFPTLNVATRKFKIIYVAWLHGSHFISFAQNWCRLLPTLRMSVRINNNNLKNIAWTGHFPALNTLPQTWLLDAFQTFLIVWDTPLPIPHIPTSTKHCFSFTSWTAGHFINLSLWADCPFCWECHLSVSLPRKLLHQFMWLLLWRSFPSSPVLFSFFLFLFFPSLFILVIYWHWQ